MEEVDKKTSESKGKEYSESIALSHPLEMPIYPRRRFRNFDNMKTWLENWAYPESDIILIEEKEMN